MVRLEFKRYEPSLDALETYKANIPARQSKIIQFFNMVKPLTEGCNFKQLTSSNSMANVKIELQPNKLDVLRIINKQTHQSSLLPISAVKQVILPIET